MRPSIDRLREVLDYNPETGMLTWRISPAPHVKAGDVAGSRTTKGYINLRVDGCQIQAHRVIFAMVKGFWPAFDVDHKDGDTTNDRWLNLRGATRSKNVANSRLSKRNNLGLKGVSRHGKNGYRAKIKINRREICLGTFTTPEAAHAAYMTKAKQLFGEFARAE